MAQTRRYKRVEKNIVFSILHALSSFFAFIGRGFLKIFRAGDRKLTIMIVPHSQKKVINFQTNVFALISGFILVTGIAVSFVYFNKQTIGTNSEISRLREENRKTQASLDELRDESSNLIQTAKRFQSRFITGNTRNKRSCLIFGIFNSAAGADCKNA